MAGISANQLKYYTKVSTKILEKTGTKIEKYQGTNFWTGKPYLVTVTRFGEGTPMKSKYGIDTMIDHGGLLPNRALISGDTVVLSGSTNPKYKASEGDFRKCFKEFIDGLKQNPKLEKKNYNPQALHNNRIYNCSDWGIELPGIY